VEAESPWISRDAWVACEDKEFDKERLRGRRCRAGLDKSSTTDLTALALLFAPTEEDPFHRLVPYFWLPGDELGQRAERDRVPYLDWRKKGWLETVPGRAISNLAVAQRCAEIAAAYDVREIAYDRWRIEDFKRVCEDEGLSLPPLVAHGQGYKDMAPAVDEFERLLVDQLLRHDGNEVMNWCAANAVIEMDPAGNRKVTKERSTGRVDGVVAAVMAASSVGTQPQAPEPQVFVIGAPSAHRSIW
jgi:phage terminase large subunit-like protein